MKSELTHGLLASGLLGVTMLLAVNVGAQKTTPQPPDTRKVSPQQIETPKTYGAAPVPAKVPDPPKPFPPPFNDPKDPTIDPKPTPDKRLLPPIKVTAGKETRPVVNDVEIGGTSAREDIYAIGPTGVWRPVIAGFAGAVLGLFGSALALPLLNRLVLSKRPNGDPIRYGGGPGPEPPPVAAGLFAAATGAQLDARLEAITEAQLVPLSAAQLAAAAAAIAEEQRAELRVALGAAKISIEDLRLVVAITRFVHAGVDLTEAQRTDLINALSKTLTEARNESLTETQRAEGIKALAAARFTSLATALRAALIEVQRTSPNVNLTTAVAAAVNAVEVDGEAVSLTEARTAEIRVVLRAALNEAQAMIRNLSGDRAASLTASHRESIVAPHRASLTALFRKVLSVVMTTTQRNALIEAFSEEARNLTNSDYALSRGYISEDELKKLRGASLAIGEMSFGIAIIGVGAAIAFGLDGWAGAGWVGGGALASVFSFSLISIERHHKYRAAYKTLVLTRFQEKAAGLNGGALSPWPTVPQNTPPNTPPASAADRPPVPRDEDVGGNAERAAS